jgi:exonuclease III
MKTPLVQQKIFATTMSLPTSLRLASYNAAGLTASKLDFCLDVLEKQAIDVLFVQETFWTDKKSTREMSPAFFHHLPHRSLPINDGTGVQRHTKAKHGLAVFVGDRLIPFKGKIKIIHEDETWQSTLTIRVGNVLITTVYFPPGMDEKDEWKSAFQAIPTVPSNDSTTVHLLLGDWNAKLGQLTGDTKTCDRAPSFISIMQSLNCTVVPFANSKATFENSRLHSSIIDFVLVSIEHLTSCSAVTVFESNGDSDHFPIIVDLMGNSSVRKFLQSPRQISIHLLKKSGRVREAYTREVNTALWDILDKYQDSWSSIQKNPKMRVRVLQKLLDDLTKSFLSTLKSSARKYCKLRKSGNGSSRSLINNDAILGNLREQRKILERRLKTYSMIEEICGDIKCCLKSVNRKFERRTKVLLRKQERQFYDLLEVKSLREQQRMIRFVRNHNQRLGARMLDSKLLDLYSDHFSAMLTFREDFIYKNSTHRGNKRARRSAKMVTVEMPEFSEISSFFSVATIEHFIKRSKDGKSPGRSGVSAEFLKPVASSVATVLRLVAEIMYCTGLCPRAFRKANIIPVPKKANSSDIKDFRPISLTELPRRIIEKCLALMLKPFERNLSPMQGGFREHRSTLDQAAVLQQVMSTRFKTRNSFTVVAFLDIKAAYDSVDRQLLWRCCRRAKIPGPVIRMLSAMFDNNRSRVVVDGKAGKWFPNLVGLLQGSSLSPLLYALFLDDLPKALLKPPFPSIPLGGTTVNSILYADDIALVAESVEDMQLLLDYCTELARERHFHWGTRKCEVLFSNPPNVPLSPLMLQSEELKVCESFKYLGIFFNGKGIDTDACVERLGESIEKAALALKIMGLKPSNYPSHIIVNHFRVFVRSCGEYALGILPLNKGQIGELESYQYNALKSLLNIKPKISRANLLACVDLETVELRRTILSAKWLYEVQHNKGTGFLVSEAWIDFLAQSPRQSQSSSFHFPSRDNSLTTKYYEQCLPHTLEAPLQQSRKSLTHSAFCFTFKADQRIQSLKDGSLPTPPHTYSIVKVLHSLGVPRDKLRFVALWMCNCVPYAGKMCGWCERETISKVHLEACVVDSFLPNARLGKRIDNLLQRAVTEPHAPSALQAVKILYKEVTRAFPPRKSSP